MEHPVLKHSQVPDALMMKQSGCASVPSPLVQSQYSGVYPATLSSRWNECEPRRTSFGAGASIQAHSVGKAQSVRIPAPSPGRPVCTDTSHDRGRSFPVVSGAPPMTMPWKAQSHMPLMTDSKISGSCRVPHWAQRTVSPRSARLLSVHAPSSPAPRGSSHSPVRDATPLMGSMRETTPLMRSRREMLPTTCSIPTKQDGISAKKVKVAVSDSVERPRLNPTESDMKTFCDLLERLEHRALGSPNLSPKETDSFTTTATELLGQQVCDAPNDTTLSRACHHDGKLGCELRLITSDISAIHKASKTDLQNFMSSLKTQVTEEILECCKIEARRLLQNEVQNCLDSQSDATMSKLQAYCEEKTLSMERSFRNELMTTVTNFAADFQLLQNQFTELHNLIVSEKSYQHRPMRKASMETNRGSTTTICYTEVDARNEDDFGVTDTTKTTLVFMDQADDVILSNQQGAPGIDQGDTIERITKLLRDRDVLKTCVVQTFKKVAPEDGFDEGDELDLTALCAFREELAAKLRLPTEAFGDLQVEIVRFDFTGTGTLKVNEAYKLVKFHLREYRKHLGGAPVTVDVPFKSVEAAGYTIVQQLGAGSQGTAFLANDNDGNSYCIKCCRKDRMNSGGVEELKEEYEALRLLHCDTIAGAFEIFQDADHFCMVGDAFYGGDLMTLKERALAQNVVMNENWWRDVFKQVFEALAFMHKQAMIHCDIKEPNVMIKIAEFQDPQVVLIDLGVARAMASRSEGVPHGTLGYVPPETWETKMWFPSGDIFSLGVVIVQLLTDKMPIPWGGDSREVVRGGIFIEECATIRDIFEATMTRQPPLHLMPADMPNLVDLAGKCLEKGLTDRPRPEEALRHPLFMAEGDRRSSLRLELNPRNKFAGIGIAQA